MKRAVMFLMFLAVFTPTAHAEWGKIEVRESSHEDDTLVVYTINYQVFNGYGIVETEAALQDKVVLLEKVRQRLEDKVRSTHPNAQATKQKICIIEAQLLPQRNGFQFSYRTPGMGSGNMCPPITLGH